MSGFSEIAKNVMTARKNYGAPEAFKLKESVESKNMTGKTITIDGCIVVSKIKYNPETKEPIMSKTGEPIYQSVAYIAFDGDKFFATKSTPLIEQLESFSGIKLIVKEKAEIEVPKIAGLKATVSTVKVRYADGKDYDLPILND